MHLHRLLPFNEIWGIPVPAEEVIQLFFADSGQKAGVGNLVPVEVKGRENHPVGPRVEEFVGMPAGCQGSGFRFAITDRAKTVPVTFTGVLPDLFREGQGVVAEGTLEPDGVFHADYVLAKHDENYMPPEVAAKLKEQGVWRGDGQSGKPPGKVN